MTSGAPLGGDGLDRVLIGQVDRIFLLGKLLESWCLAIWLFGG